jgi:Methyltransferase domain
LLRERLKNILRGPGSSEVGNPPAREAHSSVSPPAHKGKPVLHTRISRGLEQFFDWFREEAGLAMLDLGGARQENINFITSRGHTYYSEDFLRVLHDTFAAEPEDQANPGRIEYFLHQVLEYPEEQFDGVLAWDVLEYLAPPLLAATVDRLHQVLKPQGYLLAFFNAAERRESVPCYSFRIQDGRTLQVTEQGRRQPAQLFNNRSVERIFQNFESVKFFLTRERLREVIVRK